MFLLPAGADSNRPALFDSHDGRRWSRAELAADVGRISTSLRSHRKLLIFLFCRNDAATVVSLLSSVEAGHAVALLDEGTAVEHRDKLVALYEPDLILSSSRLYTDGLPGYAEIAAEEPLLYLWRRTSAHDLEIHPELAVMLSTSGSTG